MKVSDFLANEFDFFEMTTKIIFIDKKQELSIAAQMALEQSVARQLARKAEKKEKERQAELAKKAAAKEAKKPKPEVVQAVEVWSAKTK